MDGLMCFLLSIFVVVQLLKKGDTEVATGAIDGLKQDESQEIEFGYEGTEGPRYWGKKYNHCVGKHQSPINIDEHDVRTVDMLPINYTNFDVEGEVELSNNGHTVVITSNLPISIEGGPLNSKYLFTQMHFHWGRSDAEGSETYVNNHSYPMESHVVFYSANYGSVTEATEHPDGLCVLSFLYSPRSFENPEYKEIVHGLSKIQERTDQFRLDKLLTLESILTDRSHYFTYGGSLTTPPCTEAVTWIEYASTIPLAEEQLEAFRHLHSAHGTMSRNFRPVQQLHGRVIRANRDIECGPLSEKKNISPDKGHNLFLLIINITALYFLRTL